MRMTAACNYYHNLDQHSTGLLFPGQFGKHPKMSLERRRFLPIRDRRPLWPPRAMCVTATVNSIHEVGQRPASLLFPGQFGQRAEVILNCRGLFSICNEQFSRGLCFGSRS
jgi:hypothetical protein